MGSGRKGVGGVLVALLACVAAAAPTSASTWTGRQLTGEAAKVSMFGMSCPTSSLCVAVGGNNTIASSTDPTGGLGSWNVVYAGAGAMSTGISIFPGRQVRGVDCISPSLCVAVTFEGLIYTSTNPTGPAADWAVTDLDGPGPNTHLYGISCPSPSFCAAAAGKGRIATSTNPTGGQSAWSVAELGESLELRGISCPSPALCVAVGDEGEILSSTHPLGGAPAWTEVRLPGSPIDTNLYGVSCPTPALCLTGDTVGRVFTSTAPTGPAEAWGPRQGGGTVQLTAAGCVSESRCVLVDNNADVLTSMNPAGGAADWTFTNVLPYPGVDESEEFTANAMFGVSCPSIALCAVAGNRGQIFTSSDPFALSAIPAGKKDKTQRKKKRNKRPRAKIAAQPPPGVEIGGRRTKVRYRFFAVNHVQVRGFVCRVDGQPLKRCSSPKTYRVGIGRHVFRVRAIGWTGLKGPPAVSHFKVCHPTPRGWCIGAFARRSG